MSHRRLTAQQERVLGMMAKARLGEARTTLINHLVAWLRMNDARWTVPAARARVREVILRASAPARVA